MNINSLKVGQVIKDYPSLCEIVGIKTMTGKARQLQLEEISKYIRYHKSGRKYIIDDILGYPDQIMQSKSNSIYIKLIETLLAAHLAGSNSPSIELTYKKLFQVLCMVNDNYQNIYLNQSYEYVYNNIAPIDKDVYLDFRQSTYYAIKRKIKSALDSMVKKSMIQYSEEMYVCCDSEAGEVHRKPTDSEVIKYLEICRELLDKYNCNDIDEVNDKHLKWKYDSDLVKEMKTRLGWKYKYKKIKIINGITDPVNQLEKSKQELFLQARKERVEVNEKELNQAIKKMIDRVGENNYNSAVKKLEEWERGDEDWGETRSDMPKGLLSIIYRTKDNYLPDWSILSDYFIG